MKLILEEKIRKALRALQEAGALPVFELSDIRVERPKDDQFGEYTTNVALVLAKVVAKHPLALAELLASEIGNQESREATKIFENIAVVKPGHINFYLAQTVLANVVLRVLKEGRHFGDSEKGKGIRVNNEFISANPTGPLHLGNARGGFYADTLSRVLVKSGYVVTNEYYINDAGEQILKLGHSVLKDSEAVYTGTYIDVLSQRFGQGDEVTAVGQRSAQYVLEEMIQKSIREKMHIHFDVWTSEKKIVDDGYVDKAVALLREKDLIFEHAGAVWLRTTNFGDDKDRVLVKQDGTKTYFASDCGYILQKMERGFDHIIETWGADHHGYVGRFRAALRALGFTGKADFILVQLVKVVKNGQEVRMSKRAGNVITIDELIDAVGRDVARFFFLLYAPETHMNFDLGIAEEHSRKNPVFYVQYAHARLASILRKASEEGFPATGGDLSMLVHPKERELMRELLFFSELIEEIALHFSVQSLPQYAMKLADKLHTFYDECRVLDVDNTALTAARLELIQAVKIVLGETFVLMGITAPEKM